MRKVLDFFDVTPKDIRHFIHLYIKPILDPYLL